MTLIALVLLIHPTTENKILSHVETGKWQTRAEVPILSGQDPLTHFANSGLLKLMSAKFDAFNAQMKKEWVAEQDSRECSYQATTRQGVHTKNLVSTVVITDRYLGGAHGLATSATYNYAMINGHPKQISIWDVFGKSNSSSLRKILLAKAKQEPGADWLHSKDEMFKGFTDTQLNRFWFKNKETITWEFDPYELGSYASGPFSFEFKISSLKDLFGSKGLPKFMLHRV
jgi:hypothetical protein